MSQASLSFLHRHPTLSAAKHWQYLLSPYRLGSQHRQSFNKKQEAARTPFHKDYDRLIFSQSFRQLNQKTQVHPLSKQMGIHTRLTHSLEVSCIGRSLGMQVAQRLHDSLDNGLPVGVTVADVGVIIQAACLAHDIGNPPFGHAGEYAIRDWFNQQPSLLEHLSTYEQLDCLGFEGNAQGFRLLTRNEHHPDAGGMRLTCATLGAFMKYPWLAVHSNALGSDVAATGVKKYGCFHSEASILQELAHKLRLPPSKYHDGYARHPLAYLLEAADDICYALIDLEDGIHLNMLDYLEVEPLLLELIGDRGAPPEVTQNGSVVQKLAAMRGRAMMRLVDAVTGSFMANTGALLAGELEGSLFDHADVSVGSGIAKAKQLAKTKIFAHTSKVRLELMANRCLQTLLDAFMPLATKPCDTSGSLRFKDQHLSQLLQNHLKTAHRQLGNDVYANVLNILDYIVSMNDHEAYHLSQELNGHISALV